MEYVLLPGTDLKISRLVLGCEVLGGTDWGSVDKDLAISAIHAAVDNGINAFDTADVYGLGHGEEELSNALGARRHDVIVITKCGVRWQENATGRRAKTWYDSTPQYLTKAIEGSLKRLRIECIPLCLVHWPDPTTPIETVLETLVNYQAAGKIRYFGLSNFSAEEIAVAAKRNRPGALETEFNLVNHQSADGVLAVARHFGIGVLAYGVLAQGLLTGKYSKDSVFNETDRRHRLRHFQSGSWVTNERILKRLRTVASDRGKTLAQTAIRWALDEPAVSAAVVGARSPEQVVENIGALHWALTPEERNYLIAEESTTPGSSQDGGELGVMQSENHLVKRR